MVQANATATRGVGTVISGLRLMCQLANCRKFFDKGNNDDLTGVRPVKVGAYTSNKSLLDGYYWVEEQEDNFRRILVL